MSSSWTSDLIKLLRKWRHQIEKRQKAHIILCTKFNRKHYGMSIPAIIIGTASSAGMLSTFKNCNSSNSEENCDANQYIRLIAGGISLVAAVLNALQIFFDFQKQSESHKTAANNYETLYRLIDMYIMVPSSRSEPEHTLKEVIEQYDEIRKTSPPLLDMDNVHLDYEVYRNSNSSNKGSHVSSVGGSVREDIGGSDLPQNSQDTSSSSIQDKIGELNQCNTDDENQKVYIELDLDACDMNTPTPPMRRNAASKMDKIKRFLNTLSLESSAIVGRQRNKSSSTASMSSNQKNSLDFERDGFIGTERASIPSNQVDPVEIVIHSSIDTMPELERVDRYFSSE
jgi:hypothetical protein